MEIKNNNVSFNGLGVKGIIKADKAKELIVFLSSRSKLINKLEKSYNTDVFLSEDMANVTLKHKTYFDAMSRIGMEEIPVSKFTNRNEKKILALLQTAIEKSKEDWRRMDELCR